MQNPRCSPENPLNGPDKSTKKWPLSKAFWLMFIPAAVLGNLLSAFTLLALKAIAVEFSVAATLEVRIIAWLGLAVPYLGTALLGLRAILKSVRPARLSWLKTAAQIVACAYLAWAVHLVAKAFLVAGIL